jgi:CRP-like cAMP-binding protein
MELVGRMMDGSIPFDGGSLGPEFEPSPVEVGQETKLDHLQEVALFRDCSRQQLDSVARISRVVQAPAGTVLTRAGDAGEQFFVLLDGSVRVEVSPEKRVAQGPGSFFGEMSLLDGRPRSATVIAETDVRLMVIERRDFTTLLRSVPDLTMQVLVTLSQRVRQAEQALTA